MKRSHFELPRGQYGVALACFMPKYSQYSLKSLLWKGGQLSEQNTLGMPNSENILSIIGMLV
jgi:hypothetical protein